MERDRKAWLMHSPERALPSKYCIPLSIANYAATASGTFRAFESYATKSALLPKSTLQMFSGACF